VSTALRIAPDADFDVLVDKGRGRPFSRWTRAINGIETGFRPARGKRAADCVRFFGGRLWPTPPGNAAPHAGAQSAATGQSSVARRS